MPSVAYIAILGLPKVALYRISRRLFQSIVTLPRTYLSKRICKQMLCKIVDLVDRHSRWRLMNLGKRCTCVQHWHSRESEILKILRHNNG
ncbi:hypothetical protein KM043_011095 [Ampulex compressa]|nr:hypothetical protein KM043_011095 [Ampulex compressa]